MPYTADISKHLLARSGGAGEGALDIPLKLGDSQDCRRINRDHGVGGLIDLFDLGSEVSRWFYYMCAHGVNPVDFRLEVGCSRG